ncbi:DNA cytosine methyltransferase [Clostridium sporogenes]|uniref:DNA cytosine methyltransferase n=1 Tax=Clostridium sporogenes TaxID=1509 RepID=UPI00313E02E2
MNSNKKETNVWHKNVPVEKSSYINTSETDIIILNEDNFKLEPYKPTMIDLFCGAGGFSVGCEWAGFQSVLGTDYFEPALKTWRYNHSNAVAVLGDIRHITPTLLRNTLKNVGVKNINLITGGVPCQGFSNANRKHNDEDERNYLFIDYMKMVKEFEPDYIILENVSGMRSTAGGKFVEEILKYMDELGYNAKVELLNAAEFGVPQIRRRLIFVGIKRGRGLEEQFIFPTGEFKEIFKEDNNIENLNQKCFRTVFDAISDLPELNSNEHADKYTKEPETEYQKLMRGYVNVLVKEKVTDLFNHRAPKHPQSTIDKIRNTKPGEPMYERFKQRIRLSYDKPSPTQLAGGIRPQFQFGHPISARGLTIRERARIQSFPDNYRFLGGTVQERVQTGNAVPPLLVYAIAKEIIKDLKNTRRD